MNVTSGWRGSGRRPLESALGLSSVSGGGLSEVEPDSALRGGVAAPEAGARSSRRTDRRIATVLMQILCL